MQSAERLNSRVHAASVNFVATLSDPIKARVDLGLDVGLLGPPRAYPVPPPAAFCELGELGLQVLRQPLVRQRLARVAGGLELGRGPAGPAQGAGAGRGGRRSSWGCLLCVRVSLC